MISLDTNCRSCMNTSNIINKLTTRCWWWSTNTDCCSSRRDGCSYSSTNEVDCTCCTNVRSFFLDSNTSSRSNNTCQERTITNKLSCGYDTRELRSSMDSKLISIQDGCTNTNSTIVRRMLNAICDPDPVLLISRRLTNIFIRRSDPLDPLGIQNSPPNILMLSRASMEYDGFGSPSNTKISTLNIKIIGGSKSSNDIRRFQSVLEQLLQHQQPVHKHHQQ